LNALDRLLDRARDGQGSVLVIRGDAGIGKTALLNYAVAKTSGMGLAHISGAESEMELAYAGLHQLCATMLDRLDGLPPPQRDALAVAFGLREGSAPDPFLVGLAVLTLVTDVARDMPLACVIDDAQWLDRASLLAMSFTARRLQADAVAMIFSVREPSSEHVLADLPELIVSGLPDRDARAVLAASVLGRLDGRVRDRIIAEAEGNPLALVQLPRALTPAQLAGGYTVAGTRPLVSRIERSFVTRIRALPGATQQLLLMAAADSVGETAIVYRAAALLGIATDAAAPAEAVGLVSVAGQIRFRHPLVRSAVYRSAAVSQRQLVHRVLAAVMDPESDGDRIAWHRAHAASAPDEQIAAALERSAGRARARGGVAASAAFLAYATELTPDPATRGNRALAAAQEKLRAGAPDAALDLLDTAEAAPLEERQRARVELLHARIAFAVHRGRDAAPLLLAAAQRLRPLDPGLSRETYLDALSATIFAGRFAIGGDDGVRDVARAARAAPPAPGTPRAIDLLLDGLTTRLLDGYEAACPLLKRALQEFSREDAENRAPMRWYDLAGRVAMELWDFEAYQALAIRQVQLLRNLGYLTELPLALTYRAGVLVMTGSLDDAAVLLEEGDAITDATGAPPPRYIEPLVTAYRGQEELTLDQVEAIIRSATERGEGRSVSLMQYAAAVLHAGLGQHEAALAATQLAAEHDDLGMHNYALLEMVEAAARSGRTDIAEDSARRLAAQAEATRTPLALGIAARSLALVSEGQAADDLYQQAVAHLQCSGHVPQQGRTHLHYGEWLRRTRRIAEAREQLHAAHRIFTRMRADGFAERARRELLAAGEWVEERDATPADSLTGQESAIARLAREGYTNAEIATQLFISARTVEWHLGRIFAKLNISSRRSLRHALRDTSRTARSGGAAAARGGGETPTCRDVQDTPPGP
jgi:DNA-binding CsgD family transcriptional regulator